ncbi:MAG: hypothetical protein NT161_00640 [Candidatus Nomurabacteria bacterium]|nr:hypothetical protein [Candidatus Nomurabacteria bacterium]
MSKRNVILLIIILVVVVAVVFGFFYFYQPKNTTGGTTGTNFFANFLPFGKSKTTTPTNINTPTDVSGYVPTTEGEKQNARLKKISSFPVAGYGVFMKERFKDVPVITQETPPPNLPLTKGEAGGGLTSTKPVVPPTEFAPALRYVNKATGNIYQTFADKIDERKFSSTVIPKVYEAFFGNSGGSVIMRYLKGDNTIETFVGTLQKEYLGADSIGTNEVTGSFLPENISDVSVSSDASKIFYLFNTGDSVAGVSFALQTNTKIQVFDSPFTEWLSSWPNSKMITITTKPSVNVPGYMYAINPDKKDFNKIIGGINGLTTLASPDGKMVLYADNNLSLNVFTIETGNSNLLGVKTLPEKCVWGTASGVIYCAVPKFIDRGQYPDSWYQGEVSFSDQIWKIDIASGNTTMISDPTSIGGEEVDGIKLSLDEGQNYLFFVNKKDSYLWELQLK